MLTFKFNKPIFKDYADTMGQIRLKRGLDVPISGGPDQVIHDGKKITKISLIGYDYVGMKPKFEVAVGDRVKLGQLLFTDKKMAGVKYTSPGSGTIAAINRGAKRAFESIVIQLDGDDEVTFDAYDPGQLASLSTDAVRELLLESGLWTSLLARPFGKVANPSDLPHSIFVTAMDTNPLAPDVSLVLQENGDDFKNGLTVLSRLTEGKTYVCHKPDADLPVGDTGSIEVTEFKGPHPAGLPGTHIHFLDPVNRNKVVWHINAQDVVAIGKLFVSGRLYCDRVISLAGPQVKNPRLLRARVGASISELVDGELLDGENRVISGSVLSGRATRESVDFLGRYHQQVSVILEGNQREFFGWLSPGFSKYSLKKILLSAIVPGKKFALDTALNGGKRSVYPIGSYETVMPMDIIPTYLLRSLMVDDVEEAEKLGCLELVEEDLALCTFVSPAKNDYAAVLRRNLTIIEKEG